jgi:elongation factor P
MINATQIRRGMIIFMDNKLYRVEEMDHVTPGRYKSTIHVKMRDLESNIRSPFRFGSSDRVEKVSLEAKEVSYSYHDGDNYIFMDTATYDQVSLDREFIGDNVFYLKENETYQMEFFQGKPINIVPPLSMEFVVAETEKNMKGSMVQASYKPAKLEGGLEVTVPPFIEPGNVIKVDTRDGSYIERVSK